jgi:hypothetical protein
MKNKDQEAIFESYKQLILNEQNIIGDASDDDMNDIDADINDLDDDTPDEPRPKKNVVIKADEIGLNLGPVVRAILRNIPDLSEDTEIFTNLKKAIEMANSILDEEDQIKESPLKVYEKLTELGVLREEEMEADAFDDFESGKENALLQNFDDDDYDIDEDPELSKLGKRSDFATGMSRDVEKSKIEDEIRRMGTDWRGQDRDLESSNW